MAFKPERPNASDYGLLGLKSGASRKEVKSAYRRLAKEWHPDRLQQRSARDRSRAEEQFKALTAAYRRIAGAWLEEERARDKHPPQGPPATDLGGQTVRPASAHRPSMRQTKGFSRRMVVRRSFLSAGLLLAVLVLLIAVRSHYSRVHQGDSSSAGPSLADRSPTPAPSIPDSGEGAVTATPPPPAVSSRAGESPEVARPPQSGPAPTPKPFSGSSSSEVISIGSTQEDVLRIQGPPQVVRGQTWVYGVSELGFKDGRVARYNNFDGNLKVRVLPSRGMPSPAPSSYTIGSSMDEVLAVQGTPTRMEGNRWLFGFSEIRFKDGKVEEYDNYFGDLKIQLLPGKTGETGHAQRFFTVGSRAEEVLRVQGTPTSIRGNLWYYQMSSVLFRKGKVQYVFNSSGNLRFVPKEELTRSE